MGNNRQVLSAATVIGHEVKNPRGESLGKVQDVIIDPETGRVVGAVLKYENALKEAHQVSAIPWNSITLSKQDGSLYVDADAVLHPLRRAKDWPETGVPQWSTSVVVYTSSIYRGTKGA